MHHRKAPRHMCLGCKDGYKDKDGQTGSGSQVW